MAETAQSRPRSSARAVATYNKASAADATLNANAWSSDAGIAPGMVARMIPAALMPASIFSAREARDSRLPGRGRTTSTTKRPRPA